MESWADYYRGICKDPRVVIANIGEHMNFISEVARFLVPGSKALEIGSGTGLLGYPLAQAGVKVVSVDNDPEVLKMAEENAKGLKADIEFMEADAFHLPFLDTEFDVSFSQGLLEHYPDEDIDLLIKEHLRVAKGAVISVPLPGGFQEKGCGEREIDGEAWRGFFVKYNVIKVFGYGHTPNLCITVKKWIWPV